MSSFTLQLSPHWQQIALLCGCLLACISLYQLIAAIQHRQRRLLLLLPATFATATLFATLQVGNSLSLLHLLPLWLLFSAAFCCEFKPYARLRNAYNKTGWLLLLLWPIGWLQPSVISWLIAGLLLFQFVALSLPLFYSPRHHSNWLVIASLILLASGIVLTPLLAQPLWIISLSLLQWLLSLYQLANQRSQLLSRQAGIEKQLIYYRQALVKQKDAAEEMEYKFQSRNFELEVTLRELEETNRKLEAQTTTDALTGAKNRKYFDQRLLAELRRSRREQTSLSLIMLDIDHFKQVNDNYGHLTGDDCIKIVAQRAHASLKRHSDTLSRYGGEEFAIILPNTPQAGAVAVAEAVLDAIRSEACPTVSGPLPLTASAGVTSLCCNLNTQPQTIIHLADSALYRAKEAGRNNVQWMGLSEQDLPVSPIP